MKKCFITGLALLLPLVMTILILAIFMNIVTKPFLGLVQDVFSSHYFTEYSFLVPFLSRLLVFVLLILTLTVIGFIANKFIVSYLIEWSEYILHRIPFFNKIYKSTQDVVKSIFSTDSPSFSKVVLIPFPHADTLSVGLISREQLLMKSEFSSEEMIVVLVPGTPNPTVGYMLKFKYESLIFTDMTVEDAMKFVVSCGVVVPSFKLIDPSIKKDENVS